MIGRRPTISDHPRLCGANSGTGRGGYAMRGSSPLVRGKQLEQIRGTRTLRIIPACAGQTQGHEGGWCDDTDHPRLCGANVRLYWQNTLSTMSKDWICTLRSLSVVAIRRTIIDRIVDTATHCSIPCAVRAKVFWRNHSPKIAWPAAG